MLTCLYDSIPLIPPTAGGNSHKINENFILSWTELSIIQYIFFPASQTSPTVRIEPAFQTVNEFDTTEFRCIATGRPAPTVEWYRKNGPMNSNAVISGGVLRIPITTRNDEAEYFCKATNNAGVTEVRTILYVTKSKLCVEFKLTKCIFYFLRLQGGHSNNTVIIISNLK